MADRIITLRKLGLAMGRITDKVVSTYYHVRAVCKAHNLHRLQEQAQRDTRQNGVVQAMLLVTVRSDGVTNVITYGDNFAEDIAGAISQTDGTVHKFMQIAAKLITRK